MKRNIILTTIAAGLGLMLCLGLSGCGETASADMPYDGLNLDDYITVGEYKGLEVDGYKIKVSEQEVQEKVEEALKEKQENEKIAKGDELKSGDTANIDYSGKVDGETFDGGTSEGFDLVLGSGTFVEGFEDGLIGHKVGETVDVKVHFPDDYKGEKVAGKDAVFTVKINSATRPKVPEYTDAWVKENTEFNSKKAYEKSLRQEIYKEKEAEAQQEQKTSLWSDLLDATKMKKYPQEEMEAYEEVFNNQINTSAQSYNMSRDEVLKQMYGTSDEAKVKSIIEDSTKVLIKQEMLTEYLADKENLTYTDEEKEKTIAEIEGQGYTEETVKAYTGRTLDQYAHIQLLYEKAQDLLLDNAKIKEVK